MHGIINKEALWRQADMMTAHLQKRNELHKQISPFFFFTLIVKNAWYFGIFILSFFLQLSWQMHEHSRTKAILSFPVRFFSCFSCIQSDSWGAATIFFLLLFFTFYANPWKAHIKMPHKKKHDIGGTFVSTVTCLPSTITQNIPRSVPISLQHVWVTISPWQQNKVTLDRLGKLLWTHRFFPFGVLGWHK